MFSLGVFLIINFSALIIGGILLGNPGTNSWYQSLKKAPWTPPNWFFGVAWFTIMICFSFFLWIATKGHSYGELKLFYTLFAVQYVLNVSWNPMFFRLHKMGLALIIIMLLIGVIGWFTLWGFEHANYKGLLVVPYLLWLCVASSLNGYALIKNKQ